MNVQISAGSAKPQGVKIQYKDAAGVVQTIEKHIQVNVNGRPAMMVSPTALAMMTKPAAHLMRSPCPGGNCNEPKFNPPPVLAKPLTKWQKAKSLAKFGASWVAGGFRLNAKSEQQRRISLCMACEHYDQKKDKCKLCGCRMSFKTRVNDENAHCPINKW